LGLVAFYSLACPSTVHPSLSSPRCIGKVIVRLHQQTAIGAVLFYRILSRTFTGYNSGAWFIFVIVATTPRKVCIRSMIVIGISLWVRL